MLIKEVGSKRLVLPAMAVQTPFIAGGFRESSKVVELRNIAVVRALAIGELQDENGWEYFNGTFVLAAVKPRVLAYDKEKAKSLSEAFGGMAMEAKILSARKNSDRTFDIDIETMGRVVVEKFVSAGTPHLAQIRRVKESGADSAEAKSLKKTIDRQIALMVKEEKLDKGWIDFCAQSSDLSVFSDAVIYLFKKLFVDFWMSDTELQDAFEELDVTRRLRMLRDHNEKFIKEIEAQKIKDEVENKAKGAIFNQHREHVLRRQMKAIQKELGESKDEDDGGDGFKEYEERIAGAMMPPEVERHARRELSRLRAMNSQMQETRVIRDYLDRLCDIPWGIGTDDSLDIANARLVLAKDHYGLEKVNQRIIEHLAVRLLKPDRKGCVLCFNGPPGVGKTHVGRAIARAMGREFRRISLGGVRDEAEIRGHRRTYVGALPGRILRELIAVGVKNPVFQLDEIDKLGNDGLHGIPSAALLEVLDPEINNEFVDHYFGTEVPIDLSPILFLCTSNFWENIDPTLRDRLDKIDFPGYTESEKLEIARRHLVPKQLEENGLETSGVCLEDTALLGIIRHYTAEAGVRNLEREIATVLRSRAIAIAEGKSPKQVIGDDELLAILGPIRYEKLGQVDVNVPGVVTGLAWTSIGGDLLIIESSKMRKKGEVGEIQHTGHMGDVMKESVQVAFTVARRYLARHNADASDVLEKYDIHLNCPSGAIPKDGPSAGIAMTMSFISLLSGRLVRPDLAMTGEISLRGDGTILPVGGVKEKVLAAHQAGYKHVMLPRANAKDLPDVPEAARKDLNIMFVDYTDDVAKFALL